jgi:hypothetical protein
MVVELCTTIIMINMMENGRMDLDRDLVHIMLVMAQDMKVNGQMMEKRG